MTYRGFPHPVHAVSWGHRNTKVPSKAYRDAVDAEWMMLALSPTVATEDSEAKVNDSS